MFNFHTLQIVGFADDAFDIDIIKAELEGLCKNNDGLHTIDEDDEETEKDGDTTNTGKSDDIFVPKLPPKAKFGMNSMTSSFLIRRILEIIMALWRYGFIVNNITGNGASENRTAFKTLADIQAKDLFSDSKLFYR
eukprot:4828583-Ditylum_brightwellii.AAC.1